MSRQNKRERKIYTNWNIQEDLYTNVAGRSSGKMKTVFMGTPDFAVPCLQMLIDKGYRVSAVFTQPDKPKGRGNIMTPPPVKELALYNDIEVFQPSTLKDGRSTEILKAINPDIIVVVAYGKILPKSIIDLPKYGCINVHASLLPKYRGAAPIQWSVIDGEQKTGVTVMQMDEGLDTGDMLYKSETSIGKDETAGELHDRLSIIGAYAMAEALELIKSGKITRERQDESETCYAKMLDKSLCELDFNKTAAELYNQIRGLCPWPVATVTIDTKRLKIFKSEILEGGEVKDGMLTKKCADGKYLRLCTVQPDGKGKMSDTDFLRGHRARDTSRQLTIEN